MRSFRNIVCSLSLLSFLFIGAACSEEAKSYEIVMAVNVDGEMLYAPHQDPAVQTVIDTAPFQYGYFPVSVSFQLREKGSQIRLKEWEPLDPWGILTPSKLYGSKVDLQSYRIYDENGNTKNSQIENWSVCDFFERRYSDINFPNSFYLANISGLHEIKYKFVELPEYDIPETIFTVRLYAEEDERSGIAEFVAEENPDITKIDGKEGDYDTYLISRKGGFPYFKICDKDTGEDLGVGYNYYIRKLEPNYQENTVISDSLTGIGQMNWAYVQFKGNALYQPKSYYFYVIYTV